jgi:Phosphoserine aminotransferase
VCRGLYRRPKLGKSLGGLDALIARADANSKALGDWVARTALGRSSSPPTRRIRSNTSVCRQGGRIRPSRRSRQRARPLRESARKFARKEKVAFDIGAYRAAPPGLRIWCGATIETSDIEALTPWLDFAFAKTKGDLAKAA